MASSGILLVDKPGGLTSHDVVARVRRAFGTRKVGHAGTLDPMATGLLVIGIEGATRLLTFIVGATKTYHATILLGRTTTTDDADGDITGQADAAQLRRVTAEAISSGIRALTGTIKQVPSAVSAIKVDGRRAYDRVRAGENVKLAAREVTVARFEIIDKRVTDTHIEVDVEVDCSSGTYIRALARDLGETLGVGGHLTRLRRTHVGPFAVAHARSVDDLADAPLLTPAEAAAAIMPSFAATEEEARDLRHGKRLVGYAQQAPQLPAAAIDPSGHLIGILERRGSDLKSSMNMPEEAP
ncbi:tRNA pseudouridine(55) synthase TruB [Microbacterium sp. YY-01]|uniref:tRNA pseudouridine(55) synthase TruB n=1 Tax=Microbacterium sp. YY-01 TaxID=3421634 RepID=UPI003D163FAD